MTSINDDQLYELEALKSIYPTELTVESEVNPVRVSIQLGIGENEEGDEDDENGTCLLSVEMPSEYPQVAPVIELSAEDSEFTDEHLASVLEKLNALAVENVGLPMVYTIATAAQEEMTHLSEIMKQKRFEEENRKKVEEEERERHRLEGTRVTVESFLVWKTRFDEEMGRTKRAVVDPSMRRLTGREEFMRDASLCTSDIRLIEESGEELKIDESLYADADLDDAALSISDDDEEDERTQ